MQWVGRWAGTNGDGAMGLTRWGNHGSLDGNGGFVDGARFSGVCGASEVL